MSMLANWVAVLVLAIVFASILRTRNGTDEAFGIGVGLLLIGGAALYMEAAAGKALETLVLSKGRGQAIVGYSIAMGSILRLVWRIVCAIKIQR